MDISAVKSAVALSQACDLYGIQINRQGFSNCPFQPEKTPSLKIYPDDRGFYCFGCGAGGDVIKFVQVLFNITFNEALLRLNNDFNLNLTNDKPSSSEVGKRKREQAEKQRRIRATETELFKLCTLHRIYHRVLIDFQKSDLQEPDKLIFEALNNIGRVRYKIEVKQDFLCKLKSQ